MSTEVVQIPGYIAGRWHIDPTHSNVGFLVRHLMISKVRGQFTRFEGEIVTAPDPLASSVTAVIDLTSIDTSNADRDKHLRSPDFFEVDTHPTMTYRSTGIRVDGEDTVLDGDLTLKGVTRPVALNLEINGFSPDPFLEDPFSGARVGFTATGEINRTDFGVNFNAPVPGGGGLGLSERIQIMLEIQAVLQTEPAS